jgi:hypothetical protein
MNNADFYKLLGDGPTLPEGTATAVKLKFPWQFAALLQACPDTASVVALTAANPKLAQQYAMQEAAYEALGAPNWLQRAVDAAADDDETRLMIETAEPAVRAEYVGTLALAEYDQDQLCARYRELILGEMQ